MGELEVLSETIGLIYAAGTSADDWPVALLAIKALLGGVGATLEVIERSTLRHQVFHSVGFPLPTDLPYLEHYARLNPRIAADLLLSPGEASWDHRILDEAAMDRLPFYQEFLAPQGLRYSIEGVLPVPVTEFGAVTVQRSAAQGHVEAREIALMRLIGMHVGHALELTRRLASVETQAPDIINWLGEAAIVLDAEARITAVNPAAEALLRSGRGITARRGEIEFSSGEAARAYRLALRAVGEVALGRPGPPALDFTVSGAVDVPPMTISLRPLRGRRLPAEPALLMFIRDPLAPHRASLDVLQAAFGLTPAEALLAQALRDGISPSAYAAARGLSANTVYGHIRRIKEKSGRRRMVELVATLNAIGTIARPAKSD